MSCDFNKPCESDEHTVVLYHFDEGRGHEAHDACGNSFGQIGEIRISSIQRYGRERVR